MGYCMKHRGYDDKMDECPICKQDRDNKICEFKYFLRQLTSDQRLEAIDEVGSGFCRGCGTYELPCYCQNDE